MGTQTPATVRTNRVYIHISVYASTVLLNPVRLVRDK